MDKTSSPQAPRKGHLPAAQPHCHPDHHQDRDSLDNVFSFSPSLHPSYLLFWSTPSGIEMFRARSRVAQQPSSLPSLQSSLDPGLSPRPTPACGFCANLPGAPASLLRPHSVYGLAQVANSVLSHGFSVHVHRGLRIQTLVLSGSRPR